MEKKETTLKEDYMTGAKELYDLCDYMHKKAMVLKVLNTSFNETEESIMTVVRDTRITTKEIIETINNDEQHYDQYDLDYEIYKTTCRQCRSDIKIIEFAKNELGHDFNVYKCVNCGIETQDEFPNRIEHVKIYFEYQFQILDIALNSETMPEQEKQFFRDQYTSMKAAEDRYIETNNAVLKSREVSRKAIYKAITAFKGMYDELLLSKHIFDRDISEA